MNAISKTIKTVKNWWLFVLLGVLMIIAGIWVASTPLASYLTLGIMFSIVVLINGLFEIYFSISNRKIIDGYGWYLAAGLAKTVIGIILMIYPNISLGVLPLVVGFWLMFGAVSTISAAFDIKSYYIKGWGWILATGILLLIFSIMVIIDPLFGSSAIVVMTSIAIITYGISYILFGMQLRKIKKAVSNVKHAVIDGFNDLKNQVIDALKAVEETDREEVRKKLEEYEESLNS